MNKTEHYNLNQWQRHDRVLMDDFNADNAKIDAALKAEADARAAAVAAEASARQTAVAAAEGKIAWIKLADMTTSADAAQIDIDLSKLNMSTYHQLELYISPLTTKNPGAVMLRCNGEESNYYRTNTQHTFLCSMPVYDKPESVAMHKATLFLGRCVAAMPMYGTITGTGPYNFSSTDYGTPPVAWVKPASALRTLNLQLSGNSSPMFLKGTRVWLYGLRK